MPLPLKLFEVSDVVLKDETKGTNTHPPIKNLIFTHLLDVIVCKLMHLPCFKVFTHYCSKGTDLHHVPLLTFQMLA